MASISWVTKNETELVMTAVNKRWISGDVKGFIFSECLLDVCMCILGKFSIWSDVICIPSVVRALKSLVITLLWALNSRTTPIYNFTPVPCFSGERQKSQKKCLSSIYRRMWNSYISAGCIFSNLVTSEKQRIPVVSFCHAWSLFVFI